MARPLIRGATAAALTVGLLAGCDGTDAERAAPADVEAVATLEAWLPAPGSRSVDVVERSTWGTRDDERTTRGVQTLALDAEVGGTRRLSLRGPLRAETWHVDGDRLRVEADGASWLLPPLSVSPPWRAPDGSTEVTRDGECVRIVTQVRVQPGGAPAPWNDVDVRDDRTWCRGAGETQASRTSTAGNASRSVFWTATSR